MKVRNEEEGERFSVLFTSHGSKWCIYDAILCLCVAVIARVIAGIVIGGNSKLHIVGILKVTLNKAVYISTYTFISKVTKGAWF